MRTARLKPSGIPTFYHLYNRIAGDATCRPFGLREKSAFVRILNHLALFYQVKVVAYQVMSNHFHLLVHVPAKPPTPEEVVRGFQAYYPRRKPPEPGTPECDAVGQRMMDISAFMQSLQQRFTVWFNRSRPQPRQGALWAGRFKSTLLDGGAAVWAAWKYVEMNPVRAGMVKHPRHYLHGSYGAWTAHGEHPFGGAVEPCVIPILQEVYPFRRLEQVYHALDGAFPTKGHATDPKDHGEDNRCIGEHMET